MFMFVCLLSDNDYDLLTALSPLSTDL